MVTYKLVSNSTGAFKFWGGLIVEGDQDTWGTIFMRVLLYKTQIYQPCNAAPARLPCRVGLPDL